MYVYVQNAYVRAQELMFEILWVCLHVYVYVTWYVYVWLCVYMLNQSNMLSRLRFTSDISPNKDDQLSMELSRSNMRNYMYAFSFIICIWNGIYSGICLNKSTTHL